jgi:hypothetical protein
VTAVTSDRHVPNVVFTSDQTVRRRRLPMAALQIRFFLGLMLALAIGGLLGG